jgi:hypothetical protein
MHTAVRICLEEEEEEEEYLKSSIFWDITPCSPEKFLLPASRWFFAWLILLP